MTASAVSPTAPSSPSTRHTAAAAEQTNGGDAGSSTGVTPALERSSHIGEFDRAHYQRAARTILTHPLITATFPSADALPLVRRWAGPLAEELWDLFGYRLELTATAARLVRVHDELDGSRPARTRTDREFDRRRYAYLTLILAVLDRSGTQVALSELADRVAGEAAQVDGLELAAERATDRAGFVDAVGWLEERGALKVADGSARGWADDPDTGEALYDIDRDVLRAIYRPSRVLQHVETVTDLLAGDEPASSAATSRNTVRRRAGQRVRRALVERPVAYYDELDPALHGMLRSPRTVEDVAALTGAQPERRADGVLLLDVAHSFSDTRFPGPGTVHQAALLLVVAIADRIEDYDAEPPARLLLPEPVSHHLIAQLDAALPRSSVFRIDPDPSARDTVAAGPRPGASGPTEMVSTAAGPEPPGDDGEPADTPEPEHPHQRRYPFLSDAWLHGALDEVIQQYGKAFAAKWLADPDSLLDESVGLLTRLRMVRRTAGGIVVLPLLARYRNAVVTVRDRDTGETGEGLFGV